MVLILYLTSLVGCVVWLGTDQRWAALFAVAMGAFGVILHVAESLVDDEP